MSTSPVSWNPALLKTRAPELLREAQLELAYRNLRHFARYSWPCIEGGREYVSGWHIDCICDHLEAVWRGQIFRLIINIPPRHMKSTLVNVDFPAWIWLRAPHRQFLSASYAQSLTIRDNVRCRRILQHPWYQAEVLWAMKRLPRVWTHGVLELTGDQNAKERYDNNYGGYRLASSVEGALTGEGGDVILVDDPNNVVESESDAIRNSTNTWFDEAMQTRLNSPHDGAIIIIQQRTHQEDLTGHVLERYGDEYVHLVLPARYEGKVRVSLNWQDPRKGEGEPLWPQQYGDEQITALEAGLGPYAAAGQLQQRPAPRTGGMFDVTRFVVVDDMPPSPVVAEVRYWDKAGTEKRKSNDPCYTAGVKIAVLQNGKFVVRDVVRGRWRADEREATIKRTAILDGHQVRVWTEQEPGSGGKESAESTIANLAGFVVFAERPTGDKAVRAEPYSVQQLAGNVFVLNREWAKAFIDEHEHFPLSKFKDQVDAASGAFNKLARPETTSGAGWGMRKRDKMKISTEQKPLMRTA